MRVRKWSGVVALTVFGLAWLTGRAEASFITGFGNPAVAVSGTQITFESNPVGTTNAPTTISGVTISSQDSGTYFINNNFGGSFNTTGNSLQNGFFATGAQSYRFDFSVATSAFAFNFGASDNVWVLRAFDASNTLLESDNIPQTFSGNLGNYFGIAASGIKSATLTNSQLASDYVFIDNFTFQSSGSVATPVPPTILLAGFAAVSGLGLRLKRRKTTAA